MPVDCSPLVQSDAVADLDRFAWDAICNWSKHTNVNLIYNEIDYAELTRCLLWDKVARCIRQQTNPQQFEYEQQILACRSVSKVQTPHPNRLKFWLKRSRSCWHTWQDARSLPKHSLLYVPCSHPTLHTTVSEAARQMPVVVPQGTFAIANLYSIRPPMGNDQVLSAVQPICQGITEGLQAFGIELLETDQRLLQQQIAQLLLRTQQIETELSILRPKAILLFADNHFPVQSYVFVARKLGIRTIMLQHGLDCERFCLDQAYADIISVWGKARLQRYQQDSTGQPARLVVNGNPDYDRFSLPRQLNLNGNYWLWATRPHHPEKCYSPSRTPQEGFAILAALLDALTRSPNARLLIKPHPLEDLELYQAAFGDRVTLVEQPLRSLLPDASVVIAEDSTVSLEAMFFGKAVIHAHFAASVPVLPLVQYQAALPGDSAEVLQSSLQKVEHLSESEQQSLLEGQQRFLRDYASGGDRTATQQVITMIQSVLTS